MVEVRWLGSVPYQEAVDLQDDLVDSRRAGSIPDQLLLLEHPHVITLGSASDSSHVLVGLEERRELGVELFETGRGGDVTYHGPGQIVGYPILDLKPERKDVHRYLRDLEEVLLRAIHTFGVEGARVEGHTGVWTGDGKIGAIGVRVSSGWITSHGFALNVDTDLSYFTTIVPCGNPDRGVTSLASLLGHPVPTQSVITAIQDAFAQVFDATILRADGLP